MNTIINALAIESGSDYFGQPINRSGVSFDRRPGRTAHSREPIDYQNVYCRLALFKRIHIFPGSLTISHRMNENLAGCIAKIHRRQCPVSHRVFCWRGFKFRPDKKPFLALLLGTERDRNCPRSRPSPQTLCLFLWVCFPLLFPIPVPVVFIHLYPSHPIPSLHEISTWVSIELLWNIAVKKCFCLHIIYILNASNSS